MGWNYWLDEPTTEFTDSELEEHDAEVRADEINRFQEWFLKTNKYCDYPEDIEWVMEKYREYIKSNAH